MRKTIAITSDLHVMGQFERGIDNLLNELDVPDLKGIDIYIDGDMTPVYDGEWKDDPGYAAVKRIRKEMAGKMPPKEVERLAREAQEKAWETDRDEMILYGLKSQAMSMDLIDYIKEGFQKGLFNTIQKIKGNSTEIISEDQRRALEI